MNHRILTRFFVALGIAWFVLWACAPMSSNPPPTPMAEQHSREVGFGANAGTLITVYDCDEIDENIDGEERVEVAPLANVQGWLRVAVGPDDQHEAGLTGQMGMPSALSAGGYFRYTIRNNNRFFVESQFDIGGLWVGTSLPMAVRVSDSFWLTTMPGARLNMASNIELPVGIGWQINDKLRLDGEIGGHALLMGEENWYDVAPYTAIGLSTSE